MAAELCQRFLTSPSIWVVNWEEGPGLEAPNLSVMTQLLRAGREGDSREKKSATDKVLSPPSLHIHKDGPSPGPRHSGAQGGVGA